jgi:glycolate oxidase iron-sulfur subunit
MTRGSDGAGKPRGTSARPGVFSQGLLDQCISCGFCLPACPTFAMTGDEASSPRGRITLMRALQSGSIEVTDPTAQEQSSFCLGCRACEPVCPAGVQYGSLLEEWRTTQWRGRRRSWVVRALTLAVSQEWPFRLLGRLRGAARTSAGTGPSLMLGCFERVLFPEVSRATVALVPGLRVPRNQGCCGALHAHNGDLERGRQMARTLGTRVPGTIITTSGGCAAHLAAELGRSRVVELSEHLSRQDSPTVGSGRLEVDGRLARVTLQDSCHLRNGLGTWVEPRDLLDAVADFVELPNADGCCGAAGTYALLRRRDSHQILETKLEQIARLDVDFVVAVNPGCLRQLKSGLRRRRSRVHALHLAEVLERVQRNRARSQDDVR